MSRNKQVLALVKDQKAYFKEQYGKRFLDDKGKSSFWDRKIKRLNKELAAGDWLLMDNYLESFSSWYIDNSQYAWAHLRDKELQQRMFSYGTWCSYQAMKVKLETTRLRGYKDGFLSVQVLFWWSNLLLAGWLDESDEVMEFALDSTIKNGGLILEGGSTLDTFAHFLMELDCLWKGMPYNRKDFRHTEIYAEHFNDGVTDEVVFIYNPMLENWNTSDLALMDSLVTDMCDYHVSRTVEEPEDIPKDEEDYYEFSDRAYRLYPFEVLAWLKIRELAGLENPSSFFHPLMNQPLAEPITDKALERPVDLPEVNQILELVRRHFPDAKI